MAIKILRSTTAGSVPASLADGQLAINTVDEVLFYKNSAGTIKTAPIGKLASGLLAVANSLSEIATAGAAAMASARANLGIAMAAAADIWSGTSALLHVGPKSLFDAAAFVTLTDAATIAVNLGMLLNGQVTLAGNRTLGNPTNAKLGQSGVIRIVQDSTGSRTLAYGSAWDFGAAGAPTLQTIAAKEDLISYVVVDASTPRLRCAFSKGA